VDLVHGLPEEERPEGHREVGRYPHHLLLRSPLAAPLSSVLRNGMGDLRRGLRRHPPWMAGDTLLGGMYDGPFSLMGLNLPRGQPKSDNNLNSVIVPFLR
jgi:hypothetical protein